MSNRALLAEEMSKAEQTRPNNGRAQRLGAEAELFNLLITQRDAVWQASRY